MASKPPNPLASAPKHKVKIEQTLDDQSRIEELKIVMKKREMENQLKRKNITDPIVTGNQSESDSDNDQGKKKLIKKSKTVIAKKVRRTKTFTKNTVYNPTGEQEQEPVSIKIEEIPQQQAADTEISVEDIMSGLLDDEDMMEEPVLKEIKQEPMVKVEEVDVKTVSQVINEPLPVQDFYRAIQNKQQKLTQKQMQKVETKDGKLESDNVVNKYYIQLRFHTIVYGGVAKQYEFINSKLPKRMPFDTDTPESMHSIASKQTNPIPYSRAYEQSMMRNKIPGSNERDCANSTECEFLNMFGPHKIIGVECFPPNLLLAIQMKKEALPERPATCIFCKRRDEFTNWLNARRTCGSMCTLWNWQNRYNLVEEDGEYRLSDCIMSAETEVQLFLYPIVRHDRNKYRQVPMAGQPGVYMYLQEGYLTPEQHRAMRRDFC